MKLTRAQERSIERAEKRKRAEESVPTKFELPTTLKGIVCACDHTVNAKCAPGDEDAIREMCGRKLCPDCEEGLQIAQKKWAKIAEGAGSNIAEEVKKAEEESRAPDPGIWLPEHYKK